jgi:O-methyltransferase domain/Dimerisation domain
MEPLPRELMNRLTTGYWITQAVYVAAKLGLADLIKNGPCSAEMLAQATGTNAGALYRLLRALASIGCFAEDVEHGFGPTPLGECLRSDLPGSQRALAIMAGEEHYRAFGELLYSVQTGKIAFDHVYGMPVFDYLSRHADKARIFDEAMVGVHGRETVAMTDAYDFSNIGVLADVGGGNGSLLIGVLHKFPGLRGLLYDLPGVAERARENIRAAGLADRCQVVGGSFFESVPAGADAYLLRHIIHDWDDPQALTILRNIHQAVGGTGRLLVIEGVIPPGNEPFFGKLLDLAMLTIPGGRERTAEEYRELFRAAGFALTRIVPTRTEISVIEGKRS